MCLNIYELYSIYKAEDLLVDGYSWTDGEQTMLVITELINPVAIIDLEKLMVLNIFVEMHALRLILFN